MPKYLYRLAVAPFLLINEACPAQSGEPAPIIQFSPNSEWAANVAAGEPVAARDPYWTAIVYARPARQTSASPIETSSLGPRSVANAPGRVHGLDGIASFYKDGKLTASGEVFDRRAMTAAHPTLPMGTKVRVTNLTNGRSAILRINDRGPFVTGRVIDVSEAGAEALGMTGSGLAAVRVEPVAN